MQRISHAMSMGIGRIFSREGAVGEFFPGGRVGEASTGVDHTSASPDDTNKFGANGSCSARGFH